MTKTDTRSLSIEQQELLRERLIHMVEEGGISVTGAARTLGVNRKTATVWLRKFRESGGKILKQEKRGRRYGTQRTLTPAEETEIKEVILAVTPDAVGLSYALWTRDAVALLIEKRFSVRIPVRTMGLYLSRWGFTPQRPQKRANERDEVQIKRWLSVEYPKIVALARKERAEIHWGDETGISTQELYGRGYSPKGKQPIRNYNATRTSVSMASTVTRNGVLRFMVFHGALTAAIFLVFLKQLVSGSKKKVFLIVDNVRPHHARVVKEWLEQHSNQIRIFYLPPYAPEINPDEYLNNLLKQRMRRRNLPREKKDLAKEVRRTMKQIQCTPRIVARLFRETHVRYAA